MHAVVLHDDVPADARADELDVFAQAQVVEPALDAMGYTTRRVPFSLDLGAVRTALAACRPDLVFNLVEAVGGQGGLIHLAPSLLDTLRIPYTGAPTEAMVLTTNKVLAKRMLALGGLPTPEWVDSRGVGSGGDWFPGPCIIKPVCEDASVGLDESAIVEATNLGGLIELVRRRGDKLGLETFAERYVDGREFNLSLLASPGGVEVLPAAEIRFVDYAPGRPRLVDYRAKWDEESFEYSHTVRSFEFSAADEPLLVNLADPARACWSLFGLRGYARVDFRVDAAGQPWILEVNANPCLSADAGFLTAARQAGLTGADVVQRIVEDAVGGR